MQNKNYINDNFLLQNKEAEHLYHTYAAKQPIIDYHCHLPPDQIAENSIYDNISQVWINGDHYKWRAMRTFGIDEKYITGSESDKEKFIKWAHTVPHTLRNPLYHWTHLELKRYFDIDDLLSPKTAESIYESTKEKLISKEYSCQELIKKMNVKVICTTEDPIDDLSSHQLLIKHGFGVTINTAFRPDKSILINSQYYNSYIDSLGIVCDLEIDSYQDLCDALTVRIEYFHHNGCRLCDHGLNYIPYREFSESEINTIFNKRRKGQILTIAEEEKFQTSLLLFLCQIYHSKAWVQQFHLGALRNNNSRMNNILGADTGWDSIGDFSQAATLSRFMDALDNQDKLAKTILYNLNPADNEVLASMIGNFNDGSAKGKVQLGSGWWFLDQKDGIIKQLNALSNMGLLSCFVGMLTDSRSFLSFPRHEYFRRILCNLLGEEMAKGELPYDYDLIGNMVENICFHNANEYFDLNIN
jgi:glucuronate isomerase